ncbi:MAG: hypothetical protein ACK4HD_07275, partial [Pannonibacter phragmitetus]
MFLEGLPRPGNISKPNAQTQAFDADASRLEIAQAPHRLDLPSMNQAHRELASEPDSKVHEARQYVASLRVMRRMLAM